MNSAGNLSADYRCKYCVDRKAVALLVSLAESAKAVPKKSSTSRRSVTEHLVAIQG